MAAFLFRCCRMFSAVAAEPVAAGGVGLAETTAATAARPARHKGGQTSVKLQRAALEKARASGTLPEKKPNVSLEDFRENNPNSPFLKFLPVGGIYEGVEVGRPWQANDLRIKNFEDLQKVCVGCCMEGNVCSYGMCSSLSATCF